MYAEIITIGDEILIGQIVDTNSAFLGQQLNKIGIEIIQITSIKDEQSHILKALKDAETRADIIITTGGLGATKDDITKHTLCQYFNDELVLDQKTLEHVENIFEKYISHPILEANRSQAYLPSKCLALNNQYGTAPGMWFEKDNKVFISMPGVPYEMKALMRNEVIPRLKDRFNRPFILHKTVLTYGLGESAIADRIEDWENNLPNFIKLAYLPSLGRVRLRLTARGDDEKLLQNTINQEIEKLHKLIGDIIKGYEDENSIEENIAKSLTEKHLTLATAESCTGGRLATKFTEIPGASAYFKGSIVSYATSAKHDVLGISKQFIEKYSVVSAEITKEMAKRVQKMFKADIAVATTGNAGTTKGDSDAEIGTVFIALAYQSEVVVEKFNFGTHRERVTQKAVNKALEMLYDQIKV
ncbi:competence/damage-inducible protein A [Flavobacterium sp. CS20]|uniref:competence/damage-inducible protein A n=1 Tax=Flavobacterium sp. CS20 TaxID=2775246 RepID=UPI001B3A6364|nr:competence/damage-inducible protein A [Flavobacterium sp. CS20]QTY28049.1 competence/damage-inducible protein A [Flavobacterium sp. CS20]